MTKTLPFVSDPVAHRTWTDNEDGTATIIEKQNCEPILDLNKAMASYNDGYTPSREMRRVASIPLIVMQKFQAECDYPECGIKALQDHIAKKLDDPDWLWLRTAPGVVGRRLKQI